MIKVSSNNRVCFLFNGTVYKDSIIWRGWIDFCNKLLKKLEIEPTHLAAEIQGFNSRKVLNYKRNISRLCSKIEEGHDVEHLSLYVAQENFKQIAFDWYVHFTMYSSDKRNFIFLGFPEEYKEVLDVDLIEHKVREFMNVKRCQVFVMHKRDAPISYAWGIESVEDNMNATIITTRNY